jgi:hypothetical protein
VGPSKATKLMALVLLQLDLAVLGEKADLPFLWQFLSPFPRATYKDCCLRTLALFCEPAEVGGGEPESTHTFPVF